MSDTTKLILILGLLAALLTAWDRFLDRGAADSHKAGKRNGSQEGWDDTRDMRRIDVHSLTEWERAKGRTPRI